MQAAIFDAKTDDFTIRTVFSASKGLTATFNGSQDRLGKSM
jgi:hypothetical protein